VTTDPTCTTRAILIHGLAGTGNAALSRFIKLKETSVIFSEGRFDQLSIEPYGGVVQAFSRLGKIIVNKGIKTIDEIQEAYRLEYGAEWAFQSQNPRNQTGKLPSFRRESKQSRQSNDDSTESISGIASIVPDMRQFIPGNSDDLPQAIRSKMIRGKSFEQVQRSFRAFLRAICTPEKPVVLYFRGLQWADIPSLRLFQCFARDMKCRGLIIIGSYRDNEVGMFLSSTILDTCISIKVNDLRRKDFNII
jgi:predicted ATPase